MKHRIVQPRNAGENHRSQSATSSTDRHRLEQTFASSSEGHAYSWRVKTESETPREENASGRSDSKIRLYQKGS